MPYEVGAPVGLDIGPAISALDKLTAADAAFRGEQQKTAAAASAAFSQYGGQLTEVVAESRAAAAAQRQFAGDIAGLVKEIRDQAAAQRDAQRASAEAAAERRKANAEARAAAAAEKAAAKEATAAAKEVAAAERLRAKEAAAANAESEKSGGFFSNLVGKITGAKSGGEFFTNLATSVGVAGAGIFALNSIVDKVKQGLDDFGAITGVQKTLVAVAGSATAGGQEFAYIKQKSDELGLSLVPTAKAYTGLFAAAKEANLSVATTREVFEGVAGAAKVLNLSADDTNGVLLALQQIASKGTVAAEELRGQIGERLPGAFCLAAKAMGLTTAELGKQLQAGKVLASDFLPKFAAQLKLSYGDATADAATQVGSNIGRINTFFAESSAKIGAFVAPAVAALANLVSGTKTSGQVAADASSAYFRQAEAAKSLAGTVTPLLSRYEELSGLTSRNASQQQELDSVIQDLAKSVPGAVTEFDKYGKALGINGEAVKKFIGDQQNLTRYLNRDALKANTDDLVNLVKEQRRLQADLNRTETDPATGLKLRREEYKVGQGQAIPSLLSQAESDKLTSQYSEQLAKVQLDIQANLANRERLRGYNPLLPTNPTPAQLEGLIEAQEKVIKALKERQKKATDESKGDGGDFLFGKGGLNKQVEDAQKELDRLLGKVDKTAKAAADKLAAALRALYSIREQLQSKAAAAAIKDSDDQTARARMAYEEELRQISLLEQKLKEAELRVRKAGGRGANADGVIDGVQAAELASYRASTEQRLTLELARIERERQALLLSLQKESDQRELDQLEAAFNEQVRLHTREAGVLLALEQKYGRDREALLEAQATRRAQHEQKLSGSQATATTEVYGVGTAQSYYEAQLSGQQQQLDSERTFAERRLDIIKDNHSKEASEERAALAAQLLRIRNQQIALNKETEKSKFSIYRLVLGEKDGPEGRQAVDKALTEVTSTFVSALNEMNAAQQQAAQQRVQNSTQRITELTGQIAGEIQLNQAGSASNIKGLQDQINEEKAIRRQAIQDQRDAAKQKVLLDSILQASAVATTVADIFAATAYLNVAPGVGLAIAAALSAAVIGAFVASKAAAFQAANNTGAGFFTGGRTRGDSIHEERGVVHGKEFVFDHRATATYGDALFDPLHAGRPQDIKWNAPELAGLLPDFDLPARMKEEKAQAQRIQLEHSFMPLQGKFDALHGELAQIKVSNREMADKPDVVAVDGGYLMTWPNGSTKYVKVG